MFAAIYIPDFPVEAILRAEPELREQAVAVVEGAPPLVHVIAVNERAAQLGMEPAMTKLQAEAMVAALRSSSELPVASGEPAQPGGRNQQRGSAGVGSETRAAPVRGTVRQRSPEREEAAHAAVLDCACGFSPRVEDTAADTVVLDLAGLERIFGPPAKLARDMARRCSELGLETNVAVASNADTAVLAARGFAGVTIIAEGKEAERLGELPVEVLSRSMVEGQWSMASCLSFVPRGQEDQKSEIVLRQSEILQTLERWGVRNLRALAALPGIAVAERLGQDGLVWQKLARGEVRRPLRLAEPPLVFEEAVELDYPVETLEPLAFLLHRMLEQLCARLAARALATNELKLRFELEAVDVENPPQGRGDAENNLQFGIGNLQGENQVSDDENCELQIANYQSSVSPCLRGEGKFFERTLRLPVAMLDAKVFLKLWQLDLQAHPPSAPVSKVWLRAEPAEPRRAQNGLFVPQAPEAEKLEITLARIDRVVGKSSIDDPRPAASCQSRATGESEARVGSPEILDTHRPEGFRMRPFEAPSTVDRQPSTVTAPQAEPKPLTALRVFRPALAATVTLRDGRPSHLASPDRPAMRGEVLWCAGPWRSSGEWWTEQAWSRAEWDVAVRNEEGVALYRIYRDELGGKWRVEGSYD